MSNEIVIVAPQSLDETRQLSTDLAKSALLPEAVRGKQSDIIATILTGAELGLAPMQSLRGIVIIKGKPTLSADTMGALCKRRSDVCEYLMVRESTPTKATYETKRRGDPSPTTLSFTIEDANRAGLNGDNWRKFPAAMLRARALSAICRSSYPDLCLGLYDPDELAPETPGPTPERDVTPPPTRTNAVKEAIRAKAATVTVEAPPASPPHKMLIRDEAPDEPKPSPPIKTTPAAAARLAIKALLSAAGKSGDIAEKFVVSITGKAKGHDSNDVALVETALRAEAAMAEPPPHTDADSATPF